MFMVLIRFCLTSVNQKKLNRISLEVVDKNQTGKSEPGKVERLGEGEMSNAQQAALLVEAMSFNVQAEGMKAENKNCERDNMPLEYDYKSFIGIAVGLGILAQQLRESE